MKPSREHQLELWVAGQCVHNQFGECCPDFSCCRPALLWAPEVRRRFVEADQPVREKMLGMGLHAALLAEHPENAVNFVDDHPTVN